MEVREYNRPYLLGQLDRYLYVPVTLLVGPADGAVLVDGQWRNNGRSEF